ncbi:11447_t:CDS:1, partial [Racocetra persica]
RNILMPAQSYPDLIYFCSTRRIHRRDDDNINPPYDTETL